MKFSYKKGLISISLALLFIFLLAQKNHQNSESARPELGQIQTTPRLAEIMVQHKSHEDQAEGDDEKTQSFTKGFEACFKKDLPFSVRPEEMLKNISFSESVNLINLHGIEKGQAVRYQLIPTEGEMSGDQFQIRKYFVDEDDAPIPSREVFKTFNRTQLISKYLEIKSLIQATYEEKSGRQNWAGFDVQFLAINDKFQNLEIRNSKNSFLCSPNLECICF